MLCAYSCIESMQSSVLEVVNQCKLAVLWWHNGYGVECSTRGWMHPTELYPASALRSVLVYITLKYYSISQ